MKELDLYINMPWIIFQKEVEEKTYNEEQFNGLSLEYK
jgi:hypothetical protein